MTEEDRRLLKENNLMLKQIMVYLYKNDRDCRSFIENIVADLVSSGGR